MSTKSINLITANHEHWAELVLNFADIKKVLSIASAGAHGVVLGS